VAQKLHAKIMRRANQRVIVWFNEPLHSWTYQQNTMVDSPILKLLFSLQVLALIIFIDY